MKLDAESYIFPVFFMIYCLHANVELSGILDFKTLFDRHLQYIQSITTSQLIAWIGIYGTEHMGNTLYSAVIFMQL